MNTRVSLALTTAIVLFTAGAATAEDNEAGVPLAPAEAAGVWTLESGGHSLCVVKLGGAKSKTGAYTVEAPANCGDALPGGVVGWTPSSHGMNMVDGDGKSLIGFGRWSNSLLVSHRSSGVDIQLRRGT